MKLRSAFPLIFVLSLLSCASPHKPSFISVKGSHLMVENKPYRFVGFNMWYALYLGSTEEGRERLIKELDTLKSLGCTNLRILGASEKTSMATAIPRAIQTSPGVYDEELLKGLDFALAEMGKRGIFAVIYLNNYWQWSGGMSQYVSWSTGIPVPDANSTGGGGKFMHFSAQFYSDTTAIKMNRNYIKMLLNRKNSYSGLKYMDDPSVMAWELANEPRPGTDDENGESNMPAFLKWIHETATWIHTIDSNHLVTTGSEGIVGCIKNESYFLQEHDCKAIDFVTFHLWAKNWGWFDAEKYNETLPNSLLNANNYILQHIELARKLGKPITMEEFGLDRDSGAFLPSSPVSARNEYFTKILSLVTDSILNGATICGSNIWAWGGFGKPEKIELVINTPYAFLGDPLDEAQGLNSVYVSDTSTVKIVMTSARRISFAAR